MTNNIHKSQPLNSPRLPGCAGHIIRGPYKHFLLDHTIISEYTSRCIVVRFARWCASFPRRSCMYFAWRNCAATALCYSMLFLAKYGRHTSLSFISGQLHRTHSPKHLLVSNERVFWCVCDARRAWVCVVLKLLRPLPPSDFNVLISARPLSNNTLLSVGGTATPASSQYGHWNE